MRQVSGNLFSHSFRAHQIMYLGILHSHYFCCSCLYFHRFHLESYRDSIYPQLPGHPFYILSLSIELPLLRRCISILSHSLHRLVENDFPVIEWAFFRTVFHTHHDPQKFLTSDRLHPPRHCHAINFTRFFMSRFTPCGSRLKNRLIQDLSLGFSFLQSRIRLFINFILTFSLRRHSRTIHIDVFKNYRSNMLPFFWN